MCNLTPDDDGLMRQVLQDDNLAPFSSDKIRAKILDLGLSPKSARILSLLKGAELSSRNTFLISLAPLGVKFLSIT